MAVSSVLSHHALASYLWTPSKQRQIEEVRIERMTISAGARLDDYQVCNDGARLWSVQSRALHTRLNYEGFVQQRKTLHAMQVIS